MAGFFGLFDYTKPGKGVKKTQGAEKSSLFLYFEILGRKFWDLIKLNLIFMLFCLPVITIGPALAARSYILREFVKEKPVFLWSDFKDKFLENFKQTLPVGLLQLFTTVLFALNIYYLTMQLDLNETVRLFFIGLTGAVFLLFSYVYYYVYTLLVTFELSYTDAYRNSLIFAFQGFLRNTLAGILKVAFVAFLGLLLYLSFAVHPLFFFFLVLIVFFSSFALDGYTEMFITYPLISKFLKTEEETEQAESIFQDNL